MATPTTAIELSLVLPASPEALVRARSAVRDLESDLHGRASEVELLVSELVTNALRHPDCHTNSVTLEIACERELLRVEVTDGGFGFDPPSAPEAGELATSGWGLALLDNLAVGWGVRAEPHTTVWFEMELPPAEAERLAA